MVIGIVMTFVAKRTKFGRYVYAAGGNPDAAELAGINTKRITVAVFALMGLLAGIAACIELGAPRTRRPTRSAPSTSSTPSLRR